MDSVCAGVSLLTDQVPVLSTVGAGSHNVVNGLTQRESEVGIIIIIIIIITNCN